MKRIYIIEISANNENNTFNVKSKGLGIISTYVNIYSQTARKSSQNRNFIAE